MQLNNFYHLNFININKKADWLLNLQILVNLTIPAEGVHQKAAMWLIYTGMKMWKIPIKEAGDH